MEFLLYIAAGAGVGFAIGLTGVGGGSLMTPLLLLFGFPPQVAIGTDLLYASITKSGGILAHARLGSISWRVVGLLALGSLPASAVTTWILASFFQDAREYSGLLTTSLGVMLICTATVLLFRRRILAKSHEGGSALLRAAQRHRAGWTLTMGLILGVLVTLSSVGAGAFGTAMLLVLYPRLPSSQVVGTDLAHAVPLTLIAGLGHLLLGHVDFQLLGALLIGSLPAIWIGTNLGSKLPDRVLQPILVSVLLGLGVKYAVF